MPDDGSVLGDFFGAIRQVIRERAGPAAGAVGRVAGAFVPRCHVCKEPTVIPVHCLLCERPMCERHGFFHASGAALCIPCIEESGGIELDLDGTGFGGGAGGEADGFPWRQLGIAPTDDLKKIKQAYRRLASQDHPDHYEEGTPEHAAATERFKRLTAAYQDAISIAKGE